jgi:hypothetical protein
MIFSENRFTLFRIMLWRRKKMPVDAMIVSALIISVFVVFGCVLYWADRRTRDLSPSVEGAKAKRRSF